MPGNYSKVKTVVTGETITAADRNTEHDNHITNHTPAGLDDDSPNVGGMQAVVDPYPGATESLATSTQGELERLRYLLKQITGKAQWYIDPDNSTLNTSSPTYGGMTLSGATNPELVITDTTTPCTGKVISRDTSTWIGTTTNHNLTFGTNSVDRLTLDTSGALTASANASPVTIIDRPDNTNYVAIGFKIGGVSKFGIGVHSAEPVLNITDGVFTDKASFNATTGNVNIQTPGARAYHSITQSHTTSGAWQSLALDSERYDTDTIHDTVTNNSRLTCKTAGKYLIIGNIRFAVNATGSRGVRAYLNNTTVVGEHVEVVASAGTVTVLHISTIYDLAVNDYVELQGFQSSGGALNMEQAANYAPEFMIQKIG